MGVGKTELFRSRGLFATHQSTCAQIKTCDSDAQPCVSTSASCAQPTQAKIQRSPPNLPPHSHSHVADQNKIRSPLRYDHSCCILSGTLQQLPRYLHITKQGMR
jgi:hypothetical protein